MTQRSCCVPGCLVKLGDRVLLHRFPNPSNPAQIDRFRTWVMRIGGDIISKDNKFIYSNRRVCHRHFEDYYIFPSMKLSALAIPSLHIPGLKTKIPLADHHRKPLTSMFNHTKQAQLPVKEPVVISQPSIINNFEKYVGQQKELPSSDQHSQPLTSDITTFNNTKQRVHLQILVDQNEPSTLNIGQVDHKEQAQLPMKEPVIISQPSTVSTSEKSFEPNIQPEESQETDILILFNKLLDSIKTTYFGQMKHKFRGIV